MATISSSDKARARNVIEQANRLEKRINAFYLRTSESLREELMADALIVRDEHVANLIKSVPVEALMFLGVKNTSYIADFYPTLGDLVDEDGHTIQPLHGYEDNANVGRALEELRQAVAKSTPCLINEITRTRDQTRLVFDVVRIERFEIALAKRAAIKGRLNSIEPDLGEVKNATTFAGSFLVSKTNKEKVIRCIDRLEETLLDVGGNVVGIETTLAWADGLTEGEAWYEYLRKRAHYEDLIQRVTGISANGEMPLVDAELAMGIERCLTKYDCVRNALVSVEIESPQKESARLRGLVRSLRQREVERRLSDIDIDVLANGGARVGPFKSAGINNLGQLHNKSERELTRHPRITYEMAEIVLDAVNDIYWSIYDTTRCRLDPEGKPAWQLPLIKGMYANGLLPALRSERKSIAKDLGNLSEQISELVSRPRFLDNLAVSKSQRESFKRQLKVIEAELPNLERRVDSLSNGLNSAMRPSASKAWNEFEQNAASYYARLEKFGWGGPDMSASALPKTLAGKVSAFKLDTTLMKATLRGYQRFGAQYCLSQERTLIGDEMGLGKTVEAIAAMAHLANSGEKHFVVVCPLSVLINWVREVPLHSRLRAIGIQGRNRAHEFRLWCLHGGVAVTTYETVSRLDWKQLGEKRLGIVVVDEAHYIKNPRAKRTKAVTEMLMPLSKRALFLTGTPLENKVSEMNCLLAHLNPLLVSRSINEKTLMNPIAYREAIAPVYLRRRRSDVLDELPSKIEKMDWCPMTESDRKDYVHSLYNGSFASMRRVGWNHEDVAKSAKAARLKELCEEARASGTKVLVFSYFLKTLAKVEGLLGDSCGGVINGKVAPARRQQIIDEFSTSGKTALVLQVTAGGVGLNIQAASIVIFCEPQLKPSIEDQAISRSYRMGQVHTVVVHRLLMSDTVDDRIMEILDEKRAEFDTYADESKAGRESLAAIDTKTIIEMIEAERRRYNVRDGKPIDAKNAVGM